MSYSFLVVFANDGRLSLDELSMLERIAMRDGEVDDQERAVLRQIFARAAEAGLSDEVRAEIERFSTRFGI